jgi:hypothetical protein
LQAGGRGSSFWALPDVERIRTLRESLSAPLASFGQSATPSGMLFFRILLAIDTLAALVIVYFFIVGIVDGSVSSFNITLWLGILAIVAAVLGGGWMLNKSGQRAAGNVVLAVLAIPGILFGVFMLVVIIAQPNWH